MACNTVAFMLMSTDTNVNIFFLIDVFNTIISLLQITL